jgi:hypothetical protein
MENVDKLKVLVNLLDDGVELTEKVLEDGKVDFMDAQYAPQLVTLAIALFSHVKDNKDEMIAELKDVDFAEAIALLQEASK